MVWKSLLSYGSFLSLAAQSSRWEQAMNAKLVEMAVAAQKAAALQISAADNQAMAAQAQEQALAEESEATELKEEAALLLEKSEADSAIAAGEQVEANELEAAAIAEEDQSAAHAAAAALDEATFDGEMAEATGDATQAGRLEAQARGEEVGIGICEFIPLLDVACDVIGGITAVGMESLVAAETVKASTELAAAASTKIEEEREVALAADFQAKAAQDAAAAAELQTEEAAEMEAAEEERVAGEAKEAEADALLEQAQAQEEMAAEEETISAEQEDEAASVFADSVMKGVLSCWDAIMASVFGLVSCAYFSFGFVKRVVVPPLIQTLSSRRQPEVTWVTTGNTAAKLWRDLSYNLHHCAIFALVSGNFLTFFQSFSTTSLQARGGIILGFAFAGASVQTVLLHSLPGHCSRMHTWQGLMLHAARLVISLSVLYTLEMLILWVTLGPKIFANNMIRGLDHWLWWVLFLVPLTAHIWWLELPFLKTGHGPLEDLPIQNPPPSNGQATELDALLPNKHDVATYQQSKKPQTSWLTDLLLDLGKMQFPFEILILTCMTGLLIHCLGATRTLWPVSKALLLSTRPPWLVPLTIAIGVLALGGIVWSLVSGCRRRST